MTLLQKTKSNQKNQEDGETRREESWYDRNEQRMPEQVSSDCATVRRSPSNGRKIEEGLWKIISANHRLRRMNMNGIIDGGANSDDHPIPFLHSFD